MKRSFLFLLLILITGIFLFTACGGSSPKPASATFTISDLSISPAEVDIGEDVDTSVRVTNTGDLTGNYTITFKVNGVTSDTHEVTFAGHESVTSIFTTVITGKDAAGTYSVDVNGLSGTFTVKATPPSAEFTITNYDQTYSDLLKEWSDVYINYTVRNNGGVHLGA